MAIVMADKAAKVRAILAAARAKQSEQPSADEPAPALSREAAVAKLRALIAARKQQAGK